MIVSTGTGRTRLRGATLAVAMAALTYAYAPHVLAQQKAGAASLKTAPANGGAIEPLREALFAFDDAVRRGNGKAPADAAKRIDELQRLALPAKSEIRSYVQRLRQANELQAFDTLTYSRLKDAGVAGADAQLRAEGGPSALLARADSLIDDLINDRKHHGSAGSADHLLEMLGLTVALDASVKSTVCGFFWFTISLGYGTEHAYTSCYQY